MITDKINKLTLPATIIIASIILGGFYYTSQVYVQRSKVEQEHKKEENLDRCLSVADLDFDFCRNPCRGIENCELSPLLGSVGECKIQRRQDKDDCFKRYSQ